MATVTVYTAERMQEIEDNAVVGGHVDGSFHLILEQHDGGTIDAGNVRGATGATGPSGPNTQVIPMTFLGNAVVITGVVRWYAPANFTISNVILSAGTAPTGADLIVDVNKNGSTIFSTQANRPKLTAGTQFDGTSVPNTTTLVAGDYLTVDIDQIGSTLPGANIVVQIVGTLT